MIRMVAKKTQDICFHDIISIILNKARNSPMEAIGNPGSGIRLISTPVCARKTFLKS